MESIKRFPLIGMLPQRARSAERSRRPLKIWKKTLLFEIQPNFVVAALLSAVGGQCRRETRKPNPASGGVQ
jgi:hypothetical protein